MWEFLPGSMNLAVEVGFWGHFIPIIDKFAPNATVASSMRFTQERGDGDEGKGKRVAAA
jgi:hypothetical protein